MTVAIIIGCLALLALGEGLFIMSDKLPRKKVKRRK